MGPKAPARAGLVQSVRGAAEGDETALLQLTRELTAQLRRFGAYATRDSWSATVGEIAARLIDRWRETEGCAASELESLVKNCFWERVLGLMQDSHAEAYELFCTTVRRLLAREDSSHKHEGSWDDIVQITAVQLLDGWSKGSVDRPWAMLCTIARRRYLDLVRGSKPTVELTEELVGAAEEAAEAAVEILPAKARELLTEQEWGIITSMDLEGNTRVEIAGNMDMTEGQVLSARRAGLRKLYRLLGSTLPPELERIWNEMFKGAKRASPAEAAERLGMTVEDVQTSLGRARALLSLE